MKERTLIIIKPDALQRNLLGEVITRFERKGLKIIGLKMFSIDDTLIAEHYDHHKDKPFFEDLKKFMQSSPVAVMVLEGHSAINAVRLIVGPTTGREADAGSIRGDFSMSKGHNIVHASDSKETAEKEIYRFFNEDEIFNYQKLDFPAVYDESERQEMDGAS
ncbi:MAG: nucleoside-diphosphate kinase [Candidatus Kerfeldbacteria bacterium CG08_land_8_20_14_0_20_40_16]|uniref:Nucleoside diphosphate kinase n=1 Tax=Candidatus Kerfeldbacteria bacterium CG08_land_8_20_14_0_20_40_16 TaxID=2014244 RepID=A0A2H0YV40_9BACT|nr:MAG: nucleoside-diphosphate kinase [Candidatus Kerfeldbacteria bacterium CG08_land_8_20_14_0_20_40_16]